MLRFRELESSSLYAGLGVQLVDAYTGSSPLGWTKVELDLDDGGSWRRLAPDTVVSTRTASGVIWFPWLERHRDARGLAPRRYRIRVDAALSTPRYRYDADGVIAQVAPYDDAEPPAAVPAGPVAISLLPNASYPFAPNVPVLRGAVIDIFGDRVRNALVSWVDPTVPTETVLTDDDGEFCLPMRRAQLNTPIDIHAERPAPPAGGRSGDAIVRLPQDLSTFHIIQIL